MGKKIIAFFLFAVLFCLVLCGCSSGDNPEIVGKWVPSTATINGSTLKYSELGLDESYFGFVFKEEGNCTATLAGIESKGTYAFNDTAVDVNINNQTHKLNYESGVLTFTFNYDNSSTSFSFVKENENLK